MPRVVGQDESIYKRITCKHCAAINEYLESEVRTLWNRTDYGGGSDGAKGFDCAQCLSDIITERW